MQKNTIINFLFHQIIVFLTFYIPKCCLFCIDSALAETLPSCMAAKVATIAAIEMGMIDINVIGTAMNSRNPAHLFAVV